VTSDVYGNPAGTRAIVPSVATRARWTTVRQRSACEGDGASPPARAALESVEANVERGALSDMTRREVAQARSIARDPPRTSGSGRMSIPARFLLFLLLLWSAADGAS
jgi:hypothetical protein